jgi:hypothetical protein
MSSRILRIAVAFFAVLAAVSAGRLSDYARRGGYGAHVGSQFQRREAGKQAPTYQFLTKETER